MRALWGGNSDLLCKIVFVGFCGVIYIWVTCSWICYWDCGGGVGSLCNFSGSITGSSDSEDNTGVMLRFSSIISDI